MMGTGQITQTERGRNVPRQISRGMNTPIQGVFYKGMAKVSSFGPSQTGWKSAELFVLCPDGIRPDYSEIRDKNGRRVTSAIGYTTGGCINSSLFVFWQNTDGSFSPVCTACPPPARQVVVRDSSQMIGDVRRIVVSSGAVPQVDPRLCLVAGPMQHPNDCPLAPMRWRNNPGECPMPSIERQVQRQKMWGFGI